MARQSKSRQIIDSIAGQHLALSVAANLARTQLVRDPLAPHDTQQFLEITNRVGLALARVARLYVFDTETRGQLRELTLAELEGVTVKRGANVLVLKDGRTLSGVSIKRGDLRQAIAILKAIGIAGLETVEPSAQTAKANAAPSDRIEQLRSQLAEMDKLLRLPLIPAQAEQACRLAISMARNAPHGPIANLAMLLVNAVHEALSYGDEQEVRIMLTHLGSALEPRES